MSNAELTQLREALARTLASRTARLRVRRESTLLGIPVSSDDSGTIDFERGRHRLDETERPIVVDGGGVYALEPDGRHWSRPFSGSGPQPGSGQPLWVLEMLGRAVGASPGEDGALLVVADIVTADERSRHGVRMMPETVLRDARRLAIDVWLEHGRIRRARLVHVGGHLTIDLDDFDGPPSIDLPPEALLVEPDLGPPE